MAALHAVPRLFEWARLYGLLFTVSRPTPHGVLMVSALPAHGVSILQGSIEFATSKDLLFCGTLSRPCRMPYGCCVKTECFTAIQLAVQRAHGAMREQFGSCCTHDPMKQYASRATRFRAA